MGGRTGEAGALLKESPALSRNCKEISSPSQDDRQNQLIHALADKEVACVFRAHDRTPTNRQGLFLYPLLIYLIKTFLED